jgi:hypothetical protein
MAAANRPSTAIKCRRLEGMDEQCYFKKKSGPDSTQQNRAVTKKHIGTEELLALHGIRASQTIQKNFWTYANLKAIGQYLMSDVAQVRLRST